MYKIIQSSRRDDVINPLQFSPLRFVFLHIESQAWSTTGKKLLNKISRTSDRYELKDKTNVETFSVEKYISRYQKLDINVCVSWNQFSDSVAINNHFFSMSRFPKAKTRRRKNEFMEKRKGEVLRFEVNI